MTLQQRIEALGPMIDRTRQIVSRLEYSAAADAIDQVLDCVDEIHNILTDLQDAQ